MRRLMMMVPLVIGVLAAIGILASQQRNKSDQDMTKQYETAATIQTEKPTQEEPMTTEPSNPDLSLAIQASHPKYNELNAAEARVILRKGTEYAWTGEYTDNKASGTYICRQCNAALYRSEDKFDSHCGWPSFDDEIPGTVDRHEDADGFRTEIVCHNCGGHLGHVFSGERMTSKNTRHCVNSISMKFIPEGQALPPTIKLSKTDPSGASATEPRSH